MAQSIVASVGSAGLDAKRAKWKVYVIGDDQHLFQGDFFLLHPVVDWFPAEVHVGIWFEHHDGLTFEFCPSDTAQFLGFEAAAQILYQLIRYPKSDVVSGFCVFGAYVPQSDH